MTLDASSWYTLTITGEGTRLSVRIDGDTIWSGEDSGDAFLEGGLFLEIHQGTDVLMDDIRAFHLP